MAFDSLYTGITGLNAYQSWIDMISNNIANVDTTGFKGQRMTFADLFYQNTGFPSAPTNSLGGINGQQLGFGVKVNTVDTQWAQGGLQTTGINTDLAINGDGFFILGSLNGTSQPTYTRDGAFSINQNGVLYDPASGLAVQGYQATKGQLGGTLGNITIPIGLQMQATATGAGAKVGPNSNDDVFDMQMGGNLDQTQWQQSFLQSVGASANAGGIYTVSTTMYDSLGNAHKATVTYIPDSTGAVAASNTPPFAADTYVSAVAVAPATSQNDTITIKSLGAGNGYTLTDTLGNTVNVPTGQATATIGGATLTMVYPEPAASTDAQTVKVVAATNGLPASVQNAAGTAVTPATRWKVDVTFTDGTVFTDITKGGIANANGSVAAGNQPQFGTSSSGTIGYAYFDQNGQFINSSAIETGAAGWSINGNTKNLAGATEFHSTGSQPSTFEGNELSVTTWGQSAGNNATPAPPGTIALGFWSQASLAGAYTASVVTQNGFAAGTLDNITIGGDGTITGAFTNGQNETLAQVALARFSNEGGLQRVGSNQFVSSANSGLAQVGVAGTGAYGAIQSGALEQSNVSLASEFTNLIVAQRAYEANTRGISTGDQDLQTVINLRASEN